MMFFRVVIRPLPCNLFYEMDTISLEQLKELFAGLRAETSWNVDGEMLWGYFFTSKDQKKLERAAVTLGNGGYTVVDIFEAEDEPSFVLHVERVEIHTPDTLFARNQQLEALATEFELEAYDGMDVNPVSSGDDEDDEDEAEEEMEEGGEMDGLDEDVENPDLLEAIEAITKNPSEEAQENLTVQLQCGIYLVPVFSDEDGEAEEEESDEDGEPVQLLICTDDEGAEFLPLFTDVASLEAWTDEPVGAMALNAHEVWEFVLSQPECAGAVINPGGCALPLNRKLVEFLKDVAEEVEADEESEEPEA